MTQTAGFWYTFIHQLYGAYSSAVERQIVDLVVVGSIPTRHPSLLLVLTVTLSSLVEQNAFVAQLDRATDFESVGCTFEPCQTHKTEKQNIRATSSAGRATDS